MGITPQPIPSLTDCGDGSKVYPASDWAKYLVQTVGRDVMSFRRNTRVSYMIMDRARETVKEINNCIEVVDSEADGARNSFKKYTEAIDPLEKELLDLVFITEIEREQYFADVEHTVRDCISSVADWEIKRNALSTALKVLNTGDELKKLFNEADPVTAPQQTVPTCEDAQAKDDKAFLAELRDSISILVSEKPASSISHIKQPVGSLKTLQDDVIGASGTNWKTDITIKTSMLVQAVLEIVTRLVDTTPLTPDTQRHLKSIDVWKAANALVEALTSADENLSKNKYAEFEDVLMKSSTLELPSYIDLLKAAAKIRRPFQAQAFALTNLFFFLVDEFNGDSKSVVHPEHISDLNGAHDKALNALQEAATAAQKVQSFELTDPNFEGSLTVKGFTEANESIGLIFNTPKLNLASKWNQKKGELEAARVKDKERMEKLNTRFAKSPSPPTVAPTNLKVTISIVEGGNELATAPTDEEASTRLHALRWRVASLLTDSGKIERARNNGKFHYTKDDGKEVPVKLNSTLEEIKGNGSVVLKLIVA